MVKKISQQFEHLLWQVDDHKILWLGLNRADQSVNSLNRAIFNELDQAISQIQHQKPNGVVIYSAKHKGFVAGADISQFVELKTTDQAYDLIRQAQIVLNRLAALPMPTVAMIKGFCLGGGLELALACRYRIAADTQDTLLGLPEIKLGIHPGWGGTVRLPQLIGAIEAMKMILPGAAYPAAKAAQVGIVDAIVPLRQLNRAATYFILNTPKPHQPGLLARLTQMSLLRPWVAKAFYKQLSKKRIKKSHYPAPFAVIKNWQEFGAQSEQAMMAEAQSIAKLMLSSTARNLVRVFFLQDRLKNLAKQSDFKPQHIHVIGAGTMGGDIAAWCALKGLSVTLQDQSLEQLALAIKRAFNLYQHKLKKPHVIQAALDRLQPDPNGHGVKQADVVIEAIYEDLAAKQAIFAAIEPQLKSSVLLATNTSSIPLTEISTVLRQPERLVGIHFFNPVAKMQLVEVVASQQTYSHVIANAEAFVGRISRLPLPVRSTPGFLVNRILMPYLLEAMTAYEEGIAPELIDRAATEFGMPMGPVELADKVGLDICLSVANNLMQYYGGQVPEQLRNMVTKGHLGVKSGQGFYRYKQGKAIKQRNTNSQQQLPDVQQRIIDRLLDEAKTCFNEQIVADADLLDAGMIFGTGFSPFLGGPMQYSQQQQPGAKP